MDVATHVVWDKITGSWACEGDFGSGKQERERVGVKLVRVVSGGSLRRRYERRWMTLLIAFSPGIARPRVLEQI